MIEGRVPPMADDPSVHERFERFLSLAKRELQADDVRLLANDEAPPETLRIGPEVEEEQRRRVEKVRNDRDSGAVERALTSVATVSPSRPIAKQTPAVRDALCAIGSAVETRGDMGDLRCLESRQASITPHRKRASVARTP